MYSVVIVHEDGAVISRDGLTREAAESTLVKATRTLSVVYAHYSNAAYARINYYNRADD